jgi:hypothetical protein
MSSSAIVQKLRNYCNVLRDDLSARDHGRAGGMSYLLARGAQASGDYPSAESILSAAEGLRTGSEQLTYFVRSRFAFVQESCTIVENEQ